jgi:hypothetical protein
MPFSENALFRKWKLEVGKKIGPKVGKNTRTNSINGTIVDTKQSYSTRDAKSIKMIAPSRTWLFCVCEQTHLNL